MHFGRNPETRSVFEYHVPPRLESRLNTWRISNSYQWNTYAYIHYYDLGFRAISKYRCFIEIYVSARVHSLPGSYYNNNRDNAKSRRLPYRAYNTYE